MTVQTVPAYLQNASHSAAVFRQAVSAAFQSPGILGAGELAVSQQGTPNMSVILGAGRAMVAGSQVTPPSGLSFTTQAMYNTLNDGSITLTVTTANATNPRIDAVYIGVQDAFYSGSNNQAVAGIVAGTPASSPVAPSIPANSYLLGYIAVGAGVTSIVTANITSTTTTATLLPSMRVWADRANVSVSGGAGFNLLNTSNWWSQTTNTGFSTFNGTITIPATKQYEVEFGILMTGSVTSCYGVVTRNNSAANDTGKILAATGSSAAGLTMTQAAKAIQLNAGDQLRIVVDPNNSWTWDTDVNSGWFGARALN